MSQSERRHSLIYPREHGAWGILLIPLFTGAAVGLLAGGSAVSLLPLTIVVLALFWLRTPVENWLGTAPTKARTRAEFQLVRKTSLTLGAVSSGALVWLFWGWRYRELWLLGTIAMAAFVAQAIIRQIWRKARAAAQMVGAVGLTAVAPAAYYVVTGHLTLTAWSLWVLNSLFALNQIQFVQLRIRCAHASTLAAKLALGRGFLIAQAILTLALIAGCAYGLRDWYIALTFAPVLWRGFAWFLSEFQPLAVHTLGKRELAQAIAFGALLIVAMAI